MRTAEELAELKEEIKKRFKEEFDYEMSDQEIFPFVQELMQEQLRFFISKRISHLRAYDLSKFIKLFTNAPKAKKGV